jgi:hypothetical protein
MSYQFLRVNVQQTACLLKRLALSVDTAIRLWQELCYIHVSRQFIDVTEPMLRSRV